MNINRDYLIINDVKKSNVKLDNGSMFFYITDKNTQNIFVNLVINISNNDLIQKYANIENAEDYTLTMNIVKPSNTYKVVEGKLHDKEKAIFEFDLNEDCCNEIGTYRCELLTKCTINGHEEITTSNKLTYKVKASVLNDLDDIVEAPEYPLVIQLFDKLSDIEQYEEDRRANELARQLAEEQRQARFNVLDADMTDSIQAIDNKVVEVENRITAKEQAVDKLIVDTKADIDEYKVAKNQEIDDYKALKDTEINNAIANQGNKIDEAISNQNDRIAVVENNVVAQNGRLDVLETKATTHEARITAVEAKNIEQDNRLDIAENRLANVGNDITNTMQPIIDGHTARLDAIEAIDVAQNNRLDAIEAKNQQQDDRLLNIEKVNKRQDIDIKCLYGASQTIDITKEGNSIYLQNSNNGFAIIDEIQGNTLVNCNKEPNKELILNGNINTSGDNTVTITEGVDGGLVDVALEGNTMVNVCDQKVPVAITKSYTVETGNHVTLQGEYNGSCRPVVTGNTLWIDNATGEVLTAFDESKNLRLQSSFEDKVVTQEMVDAGEELAENLGKYKVDYVVTGKNKLNPANIVYGYVNTRLLIDNNSISYIMKCEPNTTYTVQVTNNNEKRIGLFTDYPVNETTTTRTLWDDNCTTFTTNSNEHWLVFYVLNRKELGVVCNIQIEEGSTATSYEPYKEHTKTLYLNSPLLEGDTIEQQGNNVVHVHRSEIRAYQTDDELTLPTDMTNTLVAKATPQYEVISQNDTILCDSYVNGHLDVDSVVPIEKVDFLHFEEELTYLYANTQYTVQFVSDKAITADITLGGTELLAQSIVEGLNRISITTPATLVDNKLIIDGVGANISEVVVTDTDREFMYFEGMKSVGEGGNLVITSSNSDNSLSNTQTLTHEPLRAVGDIKDKYVLIDGKWYIERKCGVRAYQEGDINNYITDMINTVYPLQTQTYEPIDYNPFAVYSDTTHISNNSTIPCNMTIKNTGYNCLLKPSTTYTVSSNLGLNVVTTPSTLAEDCLRFYDTDISTVTKMKDVTILEGDYTTGKPLPSHFSGIESAFEQEYDEAVGKYKVKIRVQNEDASKENYIEFYINEPLRGIGDTKDKIYIKDDKVVVERKCGQREYLDGDFGTYLTDKVNTVYPLAEPTYEEVEYNDVKLFIESFKNITLFYSSNVPVTSKLHYSYSVPIVDTVAQTANVTDQQDSMIIDLASQVAVMEMMLM